MQQLKSSELKATQAAAILKLPKNDPSVWFYQAVELYENQQFQESLALFLLAAQNRILHALPYLNKLTDKKNPLVKVSQQQQNLIDQFHSWSCVLSHSEIDINGFFNASQALIKYTKELEKERRQTSKKPQDKSKSKPKKSKATSKFLESVAENSHSLYHSAILPGNINTMTQYYLAASSGHLIAIAACIAANQKGLPENKKTVYGQLLCSPSFHAQHESYAFADRIFLGVISQSERIGKLNLHFESVRLGVIVAFVMVAKLYFCDDKKYDAAAAPYYIGARCRHSQSRLLFSDCISSISAHAKESYVGVDHNTIISDILANMTGDFDQNIMHFDRDIEFIKKLPYHSAGTLSAYVSTHKDDEALLTIPHLVDRIEAVAKNYAQDKDVSVFLYGALHQITSRQRILTQDLEEKARQDDKTLRFLDERLACNYDILIAFEKFIIIKYKIG